MIAPAPTSKIEPGIARGTLEQVVDATATKPGFIVVTFPNTSYRMHLQPANPVSSGVGKRILGRIEAKARRVDAVVTGGRYVEPVFGRPRRVQGSVVAVSPGAIVIDAGVPIHCTPTDPRQKASEFQVGQFVACDVLDGATFTPAGA